MLNRRNFIANTTKYTLGINLYHKSSLFKEEVSAPNPWLLPILKKIAKEIGVEIIVSTFSDIIKENLFDPYLKKDLESISNNYYTHNQFLSFDNHFMVFKERPFSFCCGLPMPDGIQHFSDFPEVLFYEGNQKKIGNIKQLRKPELLILEKVLAILKDRIQDLKKLRKMILPISSPVQRYRKLDENLFVGGAHYYSYFGAIGLFYYKQKNGNVFARFEFSEKENRSAPIKFFEESFLINLI